MSPWTTTAAGRSQAVLLAILLVWLGAVLSGCWTVTSQVVERNARSWHSPEVLSERIFVLQNHAVINEGNDWALGLDLYVGDACMDRGYREVHKVRLMERTPNKRAAPITLIVGIATMIATPLIVYNADTLETDPLGNPMDPGPEEAGAALGIGLGIGGGLTLAGIGTIDVTRRRAGHHERVVSSRREDLGPVSPAAPCNWKALEAGSGSLRSGAMRLPFTVKAGKATVVLPTPSPAGSGGSRLVWNIDLDGLESPEPVDLSTTRYGREAERLRAEAEAEVRAQEARARAEQEWAQRMAEIERRQREEEEDRRRLEEEALAAGGETCAPERLAEAYPQVREQFDALLTGQEASVTWTVQQEETLGDLRRCEHKVGRRAAFYYAIAHLVRGDAATAAFLVRELEGHEITESEKRQIGELKLLIVDALRDGPSAEQE
jgi:hypothetical protein